MEQFFDNINELKEIIVILTGFFVTMITQFKRGRVVDIKLEEIKQSSDAKQDAEIKAVKDGLEGVTIQVSEIKKDLDTIKRFMQTIETAQRKADFVNLLKREIRDTANNFINQIPADNVFQSLAIEGADQAYNLFKGIYYDGYSNIDTTLVKREAIAKLRNIRSQLVGQHSMSFETSEQIKNDVADSILRDLLFDLTRLRDGVFNGSSDKEFRLICIKFVRAFITQAWEVMKKPAS